ncbi:MAG: sortase [Anaerolineaceae bacterium]|nr:sortase [Anaerolineaceae bacterium]
MHTSSHKNKLLTIVSHLGISLAILTGLFASVPARPVYAATITVTNTNDSGAGSLRQAIADAANNDTITFSAGLSGGTIVLGIIALTLTESVTIDGSALASPITISGENSGWSVFNIQPDTTVNLDSLIITKGRGNNWEDGGAIYNEGILTVSNSTFSGNSGGKQGGAIYNTGTLTINHSTLSDNLLSDEPTSKGGAIYNESGSLTINDSTFSYNVASTGGGIYNYYGTVILNNSTLSDNRSNYDDGGGIFNVYGNVTVDDSTFSANVASEVGGAIYNEGTLNVDNSTFSGNVAGVGGGIGNDGNLSVSNSTFSDNFANFGGGGIDNWGTLNVNNSTFSANSAGYYLGGGGIFNTGTLTVNNSTFFANTSSQKGGGIHNYYQSATYNGTATINNSTFSANSADESGGGIFNNATLNYSNSILANSPTGEDCYNDGGTIGTNTNNLVESQVDCGTPAVSTDPLLAPLAENGGLTQTMVITSGSPANSAGDDATCEATDQRGVSRPKDAHCDMGAYESDENPTISAFMRQNPLTSPTNVNTLIFRAFFSEPVQPVSSADFTVSGTTGSITSFNSVSTSEYDLTITGGDLSSFEGIVSLDLSLSQAISDMTDNALLAAEPETDETYLMDHLSPTVTISSTASNPTNISPTPLTITFSQSITGFAMDDLLVTNGSPSNFSGSDGTYTVDITPSAYGIVSVNIPANAAIDEATNGNTAAPQFNYLYDNTFPSVTLGANTVPAHNSILFSAPALITVAFNKDVLADGSANAANIPANYVLMEAGLDKTFTTNSCADLDGINDKRISINSVGYDNAESAGPFLATLQINGGTLLPLGIYRLFICGTTSVYDTAGNRLNDGADSILDFTIMANNAVLPATGFSPGIVTQLPVQSANQTYTHSAMTMEIPSLHHKTEIVGVPFVEDTWNVSWLGSSTGWLEGSAMPTWTGNTVLTGHVWNANNQPGVFYNLKTLGYGDQFTIHAWGQTYTYEVRQNKLVSDRNIRSVMRHEELDWITLVTCESYNTNAQTYPFRRVVRAVLIDIQ